MGKEAAQATSSTSSAKDAASDDKGIPCCHGGTG